MADSSTEVPDGTTADVLAWVDGDPQRAQTALEAENCKDQPRSTLTSKLEAIIAKEDPVSTQPSTQPEPDQPDDQSDLPPSSEKVDEAGDPGRSGTSDQPDPVGPGGSDVGDTSDPSGGEATDDLQAEQEELAPEQPTVAEIYPEDKGTVVFGLVRRDPDVEVPEGEQLEPEVEPKNVEEEDLEPIAAEPVDYMQAASNTAGLVLAINGQAFSFNKQMVGALKQNVDKAVIGIAL